VVLPASWFFPSPICIFEFLNFGKVKFPLTLSFLATSPFPFPLCLHSSEQGSYPPPLFFLTFQQFFTNWFFPVFQSKILRRTTLPLIRTFFPVTVVQTPVPRLAFFRVLASSSVFNEIVLRPQLFPLMSPLIHDFGHYTF